MAPWWKGFFSLLVPTPPRGHALFATWDNNEENWNAPFSHCGTAGLSRFEYLLIGPFRDLHGEFLTF